MQLAPVVSVALTENLSIAAGPVVTMGQLSVEPFVFDAANANGIYSPGRATRYHWGGGVQGGVYFDYANADGFGEPAVFDATGKLQGLDWSSVMSVALGAQRRVSERLYVRAGYTYNQDPIKDGEAFFNIPSPLLYQHMVSAGASWQLSEAMAINLAYSYVVDNERNGPIVLPGVGTVPDSSVTNSLSAHFISFGIVMRN